MKKTTIILFTTFLLFTVCIENVKAESSSSVRKEPEIDLIESLFKLADEIVDGIFEFSEDILTLGNKEKPANAEETPTEKPVVQKEQEFDLIENISNFGVDVVKFSWKIITLGYDEQEHDNYQERPTRRQLENAEAMSVFMMIAECLANSAVGNRL